MSVIKLPQRIASSLTDHLGAHAERFAFCFADWTLTADGPAWSIDALRLIDHNWCFHLTSSQQFGLTSEVISRSDFPRAIYAIWTGASLK